MTSQTKTSSTLSEARQLADLLGIGEGDPLTNSCYSETQKERLLDSTELAEDMSESSKAQFCAQYLPALVRAPGQSTRSMRRETALFSMAAGQVLFLLHDQPIFETHFLRASSDAEDILLIFIELFTHYPRDAPIEDADVYWILFYITGMISVVLPQSLVHGSACKVNLVVPPSLGSDFLSACRTHLSAIEALTSTDPEQACMLEHLEGMLTVLPTMLGVEGLEQVVCTKRVETNSTSPGTLRCALSTLELYEWDGEEIDECGRLSDNGKKLKFCSIVRRRCSLPSRSLPPPRLTTSLPFLSVQIDRLLLSWFTNISPPFPLPRLALVELTSALSPSRRVVFNQNINERIGRSTRRSATPRAGNHDTGGSLGVDLGEESSDEMRFVCLRCVREREAAGEGARAAAL